MTAFATEVFPIPGSPVIVTSLVFVKAWRTFLTSSFLPKNGSTFGGRILEYLLIGGFFPINNTKDDHLCSSSIELRVFIIKSELWPSNPCEMLNVCWAILKLSQGVFPSLNKD